MKISNKKSLFTLAAVIIMTTGLATTGFSEDNARQASLQGNSGGSKANLIDVYTKNTIEGKVKATDHSSVSVGDVEVSGVDAQTVDIDTINEAKKIVAKDHSSVSMGRVNVSNFKGDTVKVFSKNKVSGGITAKDHSHASVGTVNVQ